YPKRARPKDEKYEAGRKIANEHTIAEIFEMQRPYGYEQTEFNHAIRHKLADLLGARYTLTRFDFDELSGVKNTKSSLGWYADHIFCFREPKFPYRPKFITCEPYKPAERENLDQFKRELREVNLRLI